MKTRCFLFLLLVSMVLCACDAKRRAQRRIRRIVERCPELLSVQAHPIDTFIELPPLADSAVMPLAPLLDGQAVKIQTEQGTFTATATNDSLTVTYEAEPEPVHFADTLRYPQIVVEEPPPGGVAGCHHHCNNDCDQNGEGFLMETFSFFLSPRPAW
ncbi:MAG: hypothetical protein F082_1748 [bacterium F082]|nr:MAG: hypothetical protein F082_1748 [bacterium F082]